MKSFFITLIITGAFNTGSYFLMRTEFQRRSDNDRDELCTSAAELGITTVIKCAIEEGVKFDPIPIDNIKRRSQNDIERLIPTIKWRWQKSYRFAMM